MSQIESKIVSEKNIGPTNKIKFITDAERARRIPPLNNSLKEIVDNGGLFNALDGTRPHSQEEADAADKAYLGQKPMNTAKEAQPRAVIRSPRRPQQPRAPQS